MKCALKEVGLLNGITSLLMGRIEPQLMVRFSIYRNNQTVGVRWKNSLGREKYELRLRAGPVWICSYPTCLAKYNIRK